MSCHEFALNSTPRRDFLHDSLPYQGFFLDRISYHNLILSAWAFLSAKSHDNKIYRNVFLECAIKRKVLLKEQLF